MYNEVACDAFLNVEYTTQIHGASISSASKSNFDDDPIYNNVGVTFNTSNTLGLLPDVDTTECNDYYCFVGEMDRTQCTDYMQGATDGEYLVRQNKVMTLNRFYQSVHNRYFFLCTAFPIVTRYIAPSIPSLLKRKFLAMQVCAGRWVVE